MLAGPFLRKALLTVHVTTSVGLLGSVAGFLCLAILGLNDAGFAPAAYPAMGALTRSIIVPLMLAALVFGVVQSLVTQWGLARHYWVLIKVFLTIVATVVLLLQVDQIEALAALPADVLVEGRWTGAKRSMILHASGGLLVLLITVVLSVYKPRGLTRYGWRKRNADL